MQVPVRIPFPLFFWTSPSMLR